MRQLARGRVGDEAGLAVRVVGRVRRLEPVVRPDGAPLLPLQRADQLFEPLDVGHDQLVLEAGLLELVFGVGLLLLVALLEPGVEDDMRQRPAAEAVAQREQVPDLLRGDPVQASAQPWLEGHVLPGLQEQRVEGEHAELAGARPGGAPAGGARTSRRWDNLVPAPGAGVWKPRR